VPREARRHPQLPWQLQRSLGSGRWWCVAASGAEASCVANRPIRSDSRPRVRRGAPRQKSRRRPRATPAA